MNRDYISIVKERLGFIFLIFLFLILLTSGVLLVFVTQNPWDVLSLYEYIPNRLGKITQNNSIGVYVTIINGLSYVFCSCVLGLSIVVSRIKD
jgi:cytochrome b561